MHAEPLDDFRHPVSRTMMETDHHSPSRPPRPISNGLSPSSRPNIHNPSPTEVRLDAIDRIQTQVSLNRASLENSVRDIKKATEHIRRLEDGFNQLSRSYTEHFERLQSDLIRQVEAFKQQLAAANSGKTNAAGEPMDDHTLEMLTRNLSTVSDKANKVDNMELDMQLIKRKMAKLEEQLGSLNLTGKEPSVQPSAVHVSHLYPGQQSPQAYGSATSAMSRQNSDLPQHSLPEPRSHAEAHTNRWATVSQALKRSTAEQTLDLSPKRTKLAPLEPRLTASSTNSDDDLHRPRVDPTSRYPDIKTMTNFGSHHDAHKELLHSNSRYESPPSSALSSRERYGQPPRPYGAEGLPQPLVRPGWPESAHRDMLVDGQLVSQGADGQYYAIAESSYSSDRRAPLGTATSSIHPKDPYAHTKKTRTKPVRNSDGILIRKDGKPDMRSQSSAANLRKVHARKEEQRAGESGWHGSPDSDQQEDASRAQSTEDTGSPSNIMLHQSESTGSSAGYRREDARRAADSHLMSNPYINSNHEHHRRRKLSSDTSPRSMHRSSLDTDRPNSSSHSSTTTSTAPERPALSAASLQPESPHSYRPLAPPTLSNPVSMQFKQPEVSMLTKQEVA